MAKNKLTTPVTSIKKDNTRMQSKVGQKLQGTKVNAKKLWGYANNLEKESQANKFLSNVLDDAGMKKSSDGYFHLSDVQGSNATFYRDKAINAINKATKGRDIPLPATEWNS